MADSPIRDGGDQPLDDEPPLPRGDGLPAEGARHDGLHDATSGDDRPHGGVPEHRDGSAPPEDEQQLPAGGEPPLPYANAERDGQADFAAEATGERYTRIVDDGLERIDEIRARIDELEAEQPGGPEGASGQSLEPGEGAPDELAGSVGLPGGPVGSGVPGDAAPDSGAPAGAGSGAPSAPQGPGAFDPTAPVGDPAGDASALDDTDRAQP